MVSPSDSSQKMDDSRSNTTCCTPSVGGCCSFRYSSSSSSTPTSSPSALSPCQKISLLFLLLLLYIAKSLWRQDAWILSYGTAHTISDERHPRLADWDHFLVHIPKSGGSYAFDVINDWLIKQPEFRTLPPAEQRLLCDGRTRPTAQFETHYPYTSPRQNNNIRCNFWMAEQPTTSHAQHSYIMLRRPRAHVLSQYFHCAESINHWDRWKYMPKLTEWLEAWVDATKNATRASLNKQFHCYDPRNLQSRYVGIWNEDGSSGSRGSRGSRGSSSIAIPPYYTVGGSVEVKATLKQGNNSMSKSSSLPLQEQLHNQFTVVGDTARMTASICVLYIRYTGGWIPDDCDCTTRRHARRRQLKLHFYGHGVRHHGSSYPTTPYQDELLQQLVTNDQALYEAAQQVLQRQIDQVQDEYGIRVCE